MATPVSITAIHSFSPLGYTKQEVWENYLQKSTLIHNRDLGSTIVAAACINNTLRQQADNLKKANDSYAMLDDSVLYGMIASRAAVAAAGWKSVDTFGINIGSSRGATSLFEKYHEQYLASGNTGIQASPSTTLGNISSWIAHDLQNNGPEISHSITCSTALHALLNGIAWLGSGMADKFLVGGSEASLTPFTIAQMKAMKIYSSLTGNYPSRAGDITKTANTMVMGEGAAVACIEKGHVPNALAVVDGIGYATKLLEHGASISASATCLQKSMKMALANTVTNDVDVIVMHSPGTIKGDRSEFLAIQEVFGPAMPLLTTNKWKIGHTFGASGMLSLEMAILMLQHNTFIDIPFTLPQQQQRDIKKILVNAVGFGGNAVSILISK